MATIIRYAHPEVSDQFVCVNSTFSSGFWQSGRQGGFSNARRFADEAEAKGFLAANHYDLPPLKVTFQQVQA